MKVKSALVVGLIALFWRLGYTTPLGAAVLVRLSGEEPAYQVLEIGSEVWLAMESGAYRVNGNSPTPVLKDVRVEVIADVGGQIWIGSAKGVFRLEGDKPAPILRNTVGETPVTVIEVDGDIVWLGTRRGLFRIAGDTATLVLEDWIHSINKIDSQIWIGTRRNA